jgi:predicted RNA-binding protein associated with RNAse of E/G family
VTSPPTIPGRKVRVLTRKWPDLPHWEFDAVRLGADAHGHWVGVPSGTWLARPERGFHAWCDHVVLIPYDAWWIATIYSRADADRPVDVYVDIATPSTWSPDEAEVRAIDLDLDVIKGPTGRIWVDDEDEFADHRVSLGYPQDVVDAAIRSCEEVLKAVTDDAAPFDGTAGVWLDRLESAHRV